LASIQERVHKVVAEQLGVELVDVLNTSRFVDDLRADSLDIVELVMGLEEEFGLVIPDEEAQKISTVGAAIVYITQRTQ